MVQKRSLLLLSGVVSSPCKIPTMSSRCRRPALGTCPRPPPLTRALQRTGSATSPYLTCSLKTPTGKAQGSVVTQLRDVTHEGSEEKRPGPASPTGFAGDLLGPADALTAFPAGKQAGQAARAIKADITFNQAQLLHKLQHAVSHTPFFVHRMDGVTLQADPQVNLAK